MRKLPTFLSGLFIALTIARVSDFSTNRMGSWPVTSWLFSLGMAATIYTAAYFTREHITIKDGVNEDRRSANVRGIAVAALFMFMLVDGFFNLAEVISALPADPSPWVRLGGYVYGVFPTLASGVLGMLQGFVDRLPHVQRPAATTGISLRIIRKVENWLDDDTPQTATLPQVEPLALPQTATPARFTCGCGWSSAEAEREGRDPQRAYAAHRRQEQRKAAEVVK